MERQRNWGRWITIGLLGLIVLELSAILHVLTEESGGGRGNIAVVEVNGPIESADETVRALKRYAKREDVRAIVLRVDSPGGTVGASQEIFEAVREATRSKPVVASMGDVAASGGYYISAPATKIMALPGTLTGSIGVIAHFFMLDDLLKTAHLRWEVLKSGKSKDVGSPLRPMTADEKRMMQAMIDDVHTQFVEDVAQGRKLPTEKVRALADGRVFTGRQAKKDGLIDEIGGLERAIELAAKLGNVKGEPEPIYPPREHFGWIKRLAEGRLQTSAFSLEYRLVP